MANRTFAAEYVKLREIFVDARHSQGLTQVQLAVRLGKPQSYVSKLERGERRIDLIELFELSAALGVQPEHLIRACFRVWSGEK
jgi:transcriptional regulator with XRE-family HTH domain